MNDAWITFIKPLLFKLFEKFEEMINLYHEIFFILLERIEERGNANKEDSLKKIAILVNKLTELKDYVELVERNIISFIDIVKNNKFYLQSNFLPYLNKLINKEQVSIKHLQEKLLDIQTAIDFTEKKIMEIEMSLVALCINLFISSFSGNVFLVLAEIVAIAGLTITDIVFHDKLTEYKKEKIAIMTKLQQDFFNLNYLINLHNDFQAFLQAYSQMDSIFSAFKNSLYELENLLIIISNKFGTAYNKLNSENYRYLKATFRVINMELKNLTENLKNNYVLHHLPIKKNYKAVV